MMPLFHVTPRQMSVENHASSVRRSVGGFGRSATTARSRRRRRALGGAVQRQDPLLSAVNVTYSTGTSLDIVRYKNYLPLLIPRGCLRQQFRLPCLPLQAQGQRYNQSILLRLNYALSQSRYCLYPLTAVVQILILTRPQNAGLLWVHPVYIRSCL